MASATLEREVEVTKAPAAVSVEDAARTETRARVEGSGATSEARAWNAQAQID